MKRLSQNYAHVQMSLLELQKAIASYEDREEQTPADTQKLISLFTKTFTSFCELIAAYLTVHHHNFTAGTTPEEMLMHAHKAGFLADHDYKTLSRALKESKIPVAQGQESPLVHTIETYTETMQTILQEIKPE